MSEKSFLYDNFHLELFGLRVCGGKLTNSGDETVAEITRICLEYLKENLGVGDEIYRWNNVCLRGKSHDEVSAVLAATSNLPCVPIEFRKTSPYVFLLSYK